MLATLRGWAILVVMKSDIGNRHDRCCRHSICGEFAKLKFSASLVWFEVQ